MIIRKATADDSHTLAALGAATFSSAFEHLYKPEDLVAFLSENHSEAYYAQALSDPKIHIWLVEIDGEAVAYLKVGPNSLPCDPPKPAALELSRLYVLPKYWRKGIGRKLIDICFDYARINGFNEIVLSVWQENHDGQRLYRSYGFDTIGEYQFKVGNHMDEEFIFCAKV